MTSGDFQIVILTGTASGQTYPLAEGDTKVGRSRTNQIVIEDASASRHHLTLRRTGDTVMIEDVGSSHGTFLNEKRLRGIVSLAHGDVFQVGEVQCRFEMPQADEDGGETRYVEPSAAAAVAEEPASSPASASATRFAEVEESAPETSYMPVEEVQEEDESDKTRMIGGGETRMLDMDELKGLRPGRKEARSGKRVAMGVILLLLLVVAAVVYVARVVSVPTEAQTASQTELYKDEQLQFWIRYPAAWSRTKEAAPEAIISFRSDSKLGRLDIFALRSERIRRTGLTLGFDEYVAEMKGRHEGFTLKRHRRRRKGDLELYTFRADTSTEGLAGVFLLAGERRIAVECRARLDEYPHLAPVFAVILGSLGIEDRQEFIDFPRPDNAMHRRALGQPAALMKEIEEHIEIGADLVKNRSVRRSNLFYAIKEYQAALQMICAFNVRPEALYNKAAIGLSKASEMYRSGVADLKFAITVAEKQGDREAAYWDATKLVQMIPDKTDIDHQYALRRVKGYTPE